MSAKRRPALAGAGAENITKRCAAYRTTPKRTTSGLLLFNAAGVKSTLAVRASGEHPNRRRRATVAKSLATCSQARRRGQVARDRGMERGAQRKEWLISRDTLRFLEAMMARADRMASLDDAADSLAETFSDGGRWRGSIPKSLASEGLIAKASIGYSARPSRHRRYVILWRAVDLAGIERKRAELREWLAAHSRPVELVGESLFDDLVGQRKVEHAL